MTIQFIEYPKCTTCKKAKAWLTEQGVEFTDRHIVEQALSADELRTLIESSGLASKKFFNTCGMLYKSMGLKDKLPTMSLDEQIALLSTDGMLVKRPLLVVDGKVCVGFKAEAWADALKN